MLSFRPKITFLFIIAVTAILFGSCTLTQRRYRSGFHLEWKHRYKAPESDFSTSEKVAPALAEISDTNNHSDHVSSIRPTGETAIVIHKDNSAESPIVYHAFPQRIIQSPIQIKQRDEVDHTIKTITKEHFQKKSRDQNGGLFLLWFLLLMAMLVIPPILFTIASYWIDLSKMGIACLWIIWAAGIVAALLLFSGLWPIILSCLIWNVVFTIMGLIIVLVNA
ncbi:MAG: hypothetical protein V4604_13515 [Bacteroidota bacterium]